jgi:polar amino acid transport system substrate-binding protein
VGRALLEKDSPLTPCVNDAIASLKESGELDEITQQWMSESADAPVLQ